MATQACCFLTCGYSFWLHCWDWSYGISNKLSDCQIHVLAPRPNAVAVDAFTADWRSLNFWCFPPFSIILRVLHKIQLDKATGLLVVPPLAYTTLVPNTNETPNRSSTSSSTAAQAAPTAGQTTGVPPTTGKAPADGMQIIRKSLQDQGLSGESTNIVLSSWWPTTTRQYSSYISKWTAYCHERKSDPVYSTIPEVLNFLTALFRSGLGYSAINTAKSALASLVVLPMGQVLGKDPVVMRYMKGIFEKRPSLPRYSATWDVSLVLQHLQGMDMNTVSLKQLTMNMTVLLALLTGQQLQTLRAIKLEHLHCCCALTASLCQHPGRGHLLISFRKPHGPVVEDALSRWIKNSFAAAGINTTLFGAHSNRSASTSAAARHGAPLELILKAANWQQAKTFAKFYHRNVPSLDTGFMDAVLPDLRDKQS